MELNKKYFEEKLKKIRRTMWGSFSGDHIERFTLKQLHQIAQDAAEMQNDADIAATAGLMVAGTIREARITAFPDVAKEVDDDFGVQAECDIDCGAK